MQKLLTLEEAAETLGVDYKTVYRLVRAGDLVAGKIGRVYRIAPEDLKAYFESTKTSSTTKRPVALQGLRCAVTGRPIVSEQDIADRDKQDESVVISRRAWEDGYRFPLPGQSPSG